jgi:DNA-binding NtrC family response regulator
MKKRILIIDDESAIRLYLEEIFEQEGYDAVTVSNSRDGLEYARGGGFYAIVTDMVMPGMQGVEMIAALRRGGSDTPIVVMTGYSNGDARLQELQDYCVDCVVYKPFRAHEVVIAVEQAVQSRRLKSMAS